MIHQAKKISLLTLLCNLFLFTAMAQNEKTQFTHADTLRGSLNSERRYDVLKYDISFTPDFENKSIRGKNIITYRDSSYTMQANNPGLQQIGVIQIDLQEPLQIDSIIQDDLKLEFKREGNVFHVKTLNEISNKKKQSESCTNCIRQLTIYYQGNPQIAVRPPWGGGFIFTRDSLGRPWMSVAC